MLISGLTTIGNLLATAVLTIVHYCVVGIGMCTGWATATKVGQKVTNAYQQRKGHKILEKEAAYIEGKLASSAAAVEPTIVGDVPVRTAHQAN